MPGTVLSLFSGAGGMDLGLEAAGFDTLGAVEVGAVQRETLARNRAWKLLGDGDINGLATWLRPDDLGLRSGELDLIAGGPPCQPFSMAAQWARDGRRGLLDSRAVTVISTMRLVERFLPRAVLMENVAGFVTGAGAALDFLRDEFDSIGERTGARYTLSAKIVNAAHYGVPQNRRRAIVVALRGDQAFAWPDTRWEQSPLTAWDALHDIAPAAPPAPQGKWAELLPVIPPGHNYQWLTARGGGPELFGYRTKYWNFLLKLAPELPAWTLSASPGPSTGPFHWENRPLSVREQLRLQSFPDEWHVVGDYRRQTLQVGNATPPALAEALGIALQQQLFGGHTAKQRLVRPRAASGPPHVPVADLPARYSAQVGPRRAHRGEGRGPAPRTAAGVSLKD